MANKSVSSFPSPTASLHSQKSLKTTKKFYNMSTITAPLYFQFPPGQAEIYKQQSQIIGICPSGFTVRHVDVSSLQENAYEFVSNTDKNLKITILVHVEGIAGLRRITMKSSVSIQNKLPFPLEVIHPNVPRSDFIYTSKTVC